MAQSMMSAPAAAAASCVATPVPGSGTIGGQEEVREMQRKWASVAGLSGCSKLAGASKGNHSLLARLKKEYALGVD